MANKFSKLTSQVSFSDLFFNQASVGLNLCRYQDGKWLKSNPAFLKIIGYSAEEADEGLSYWQLTPPHYEKQEQIQLEALQKTGKYGPYEKEFIRKNGELIPVRLNGFIIESEGEKYIWSIVEDLTERKSYEKKLEEALHIAEMANGHKSQFMATMSHEIRTPLNGILGMISSLESEIQNPDHLNKIKIIKSSGTILKALIEDILDFSQIDTGKIKLNPVPTNLDKTVEDIVALLTPKARDKGLQFNYERIGESVHHCIVDQVRLTQIIFNLLSNAIKFTSSGSVGLTLQTHHTIDHKLKVSFIIKDTGIGISPHEVVNLFRPFSQANDKIAKKFGGTGLGLSISQKIANQMGGEIRHQQNMPQGSVFIFDVELQVMNQTTHEQSRNELKLVTSQPTHHLKILITEDNKINQEVIKALLSNIGCDDITIANNGQEAVELVNKNHFDIIFMDLQMPIMDGIEATHKIRALKEHQDKWIIALTANAYPEDQARCFEAGMNGFIAKPIDFNQLKEIITKRKLNLAS